MVDVNSFQTVSNGDRLYEGYYNGIYNQIFNNFDLITENIVKQYMNDYSNGNLNYKPDYLDIDLFTSDTASVSYNLDYNSTNNLYETPVWSGSSLYYMDIQADDSSDTNSEANITQMSENTWRVWQDSSDYETNRALVIEHLFYGGSNSRLMSNYTNVSAIKTIDSNDTGYRFTYITTNITAGNDGGGEGQHRFSFSDTSNNTRTCIWLKMVESGGGSSYDIELPSGNIIWSGANSVDYFGTDTSNKRTDNPSDYKVVIDTYSGDTDGFTSHTILMYQTGSIISEGFTNNSVNTLDHSASKYDFYFDGNIPEVSLSDDSGLTSTLITDSFALTTEQNNVFVNTEKELDGSANMDFYVSLDGGSNYTSINDDEWAYNLSNIGSNAKVKWVINRSSSDEICKISAYGAWFR